MRLTLPRLLALLALAAVLAVLALADTVAAGVAVAGLAAGTLVVRRRSPSGARFGAVMAVTGATLAAVVAALVLPTYAGRPAPLVVTRKSAGVAPAAGAAHLPGIDPAAGGTFEALGFVASDYNDSGEGVDRDAARLSTLAATGIVLAKSPGSIEISPASDTLMRAHLNGAKGLAVVSNFDGTEFNTQRAQRMLRSAEGRRRFISALTGEVGRRGWDGVVLDFEKLAPEARAFYPQLVQDLEDALGPRQLIVAIPAFASADDPDLVAYDLAALGQAADRVVLMAYDQHELGDPPGPVAGLPWVRQTLALAEQAVPKHKLMLGVAGYGYAWSSAGHATETSVALAKALADAPGASTSWDEVQGEWSVRTADGRHLWYDDARSFGLRAQLAADEGLAGVALWRVGSEEPATLSRIPRPVVKYPAQPADRPVQQVAAEGVIALTFDDGPDPTWTPRILAILAKKHVPATFFVVGTEAQSHPGILKEEVRNGHVVGNHTYSHRDLSKMPVLRAKAEIIGAEAVVEGITGRKPYLFRSPYGAGDMTGGALGSDQLATDLGLHPVSWNDDTDDWRRPGTDAIVRRAVDLATERSVILLHDGGGERDQTVAALPRIIDELRARGYLFTTADAIDGSISSPYMVRHGLADQARGVALVAAYRLQMAGRRVLLWLLMAIAVISILRLAVCGPLALHHLFRSRRRRTAVQADLSISIVIPAHNEARVLAKTLEAVRRVRWSGLEVLVVDDGSTDGTADVARRFAVGLISQARAGKAVALNTGIAAAAGEVVVVLDADTVLDPGFAVAVASHFADPAVGAVAGNVRVGNRRGLLARLQALEYIVSLNLDRRAQAALNVVSVVPGAAGAFRRRAVLDAGGYPGDTLVEDADLTVALLRAGWRIPYEDAAVAWTEAPERVGDVLNQRRRWSYGTVEVAAKHAGSVLDPSEGRVGLMALPWLVLSQVLLPLAGPIADLFLVYLIAVGNLGVVAGILGVALGIDLVVIFAAVVMDREDLRLVALAPLLRLVWRPLQLVAVATSVHYWARGRTQSWRRVKRYNSVVLPGRPRGIPEGATPVGSVSPAARGVETVANRSVLSGRVRGHRPRGGSAPLRYGSDDIGPPRIARGRRPGG